MRLMILPTITNQTNIQGAKELRQGRGEIHPNRDCKLEELVYHETAMQK